jgi:hypothetical protein
MKARWMAGVGALLLVGGMLAGGCNLVVGYRDAVLGTGGGAGSGGSGHGGNGHGGNGHGGNGHGGNGGGPVCTPGHKLACYSGAPGTEGVAACKGGTATCLADGSGFGTCEGEVAPQPETCADPSDEDCDGLDCVHWAGLLGDSAEQHANAVAVDASGNSFVVGDFSGTIAVPGGPLTAVGTSDLFIVKLDPSGKPLWGRSYTAPGAAAHAQAATTDAMGNVIVGGVAEQWITIGGAMLNPGLFVAKLSGDGQVVWTRGFTTVFKMPSFDAIRALATTPDGDVLVGGQFTSEADFGEGKTAAPTIAGVRDGFVAKLRGTNGSSAIAAGGWGRAVSTNNDWCEVTGVGSDAAGNVLLAGNALKTVTFGPGFSLSYPGTGQYGFIGQLAADGTPKWKRSISYTSGNGVVVLGGLGVDSSGGAIITGSLLNGGGVDFGGGDASVLAIANFIARYDSVSSYVSSKLFGASYAFSMVADGAGNAFLAGTFASSLDLGGGALPSAGGSDVFVAKLSPTNALVWAKVYGDAADQSAAALALTPQGGPVVAGSTAGMTNFGTGPLTSAGGADAFAVQLSP